MQYLRSRGPLGFHRGRLPVSRDMSRAVEMESTISPPKFDNMIDIHHNIFCPEAGATRVAIQGIGQRAIACGFGDNGCYSTNGGREEHRGGNILEYEASHVEDVFEPNSQTGCLIYCATELLTHARATERSGVRVRRSNARAHRRGIILARSRLQNDGGVKVK